MSKYIREHVSLLWLWVYHDHTLTDSERSHLRVPPRSPMMLGRMAGPLSGCGIAGKRGAGNRSPGPGTAVEKCPRLSTCPEAQGMDREKWAGVTAEDAGGRPRSTSRAKTWGLTIPRLLSQSVAQGAGQAVCPSVQMSRGGKNRGGRSFESGVL